MSDEGNLAKINRLIENFKLTDDLSDPTLRGYFDTYERLRRAQYHSRKPQSTNMSEQTLEDGANSESSSSSSDEQEALSNECSSSTNRSCQTVPETTVSPHDIQILPKNTGYFATRSTAKNAAAALLPKSQASKPTAKNNFSCCTIQ